MIRRFFSYYRPYKKLFLIDFGCAVLAGLLELAFPLAVSKFINELFRSGLASHYACLRRAVIHLCT